MKLVNIGFGNMVSAERIIAVVSPESAPVKRMISEAKESGMLIDATQGRKTKTVIVTDSGHLVLSYLLLEAIANRVSDEAVIGFGGEDDE